MSDHTVPGEVVHPQPLDHPDGGDHRSFGPVGQLGRLGRLGIDPAALAVLVGSALVLLVQLPGVPGPVRAAVAVTWFVAVPGLAWAWALPVDDGVERFAAVVALSLALDVVVAEGFVYLGLAGAFPAVLALVALSALGVVVGRRRLGST